LCLAANIEERGCVCVSVEGRKDIEMNQPRAVHVTEGEGKTLWVADELMTFKATAEDTGGAYSLTDSLVPPGGGPPPHIHHREDEAFWVLEGELEVVVGETTFKAGPGSFVLNEASQTTSGGGSEKWGILRRPYNLSPPRVTVVTPRTG
jgi:mannose-6-phosphate isomerase-like protein (cupin superfamily)